MKLCLRLVTDMLGAGSGSLHIKKDDFDLERWEVWSSNRKAEKGVLYIVQTYEMPFVDTDTQAAYICQSPVLNRDLKLPDRLYELDGSISPGDVINKINKIFYTCNDFEYRLQKAVTNGEDFQSLIDIAEPFFENGMAIVDADFRNVAQTNTRPNMCDLSGIEQPDNDGFLSRDIVQMLINDREFTEKWKLTEPFFYGDKQFACRSICMNSFYEGDYACRLIVSEDRHPFREYEMELVRFFNTFVQLMVERAPYSSSILPKGHLSILLHNILDGENVEPDVLKDSVRRYGWSGSGPFACASILIFGLNYSYRIKGYKMQNITKGIKECCAFAYEDGIVMVVDLSGYNGSIDDFRAAYIETFRDAYFRIGFSNVFEDLVKLDAYYMQARIALQTGEAADSTIWYHKFSDIVMPYIQTELTRELPADMLRAREIILLQQYDAANETALVETLRVYLSNHLNAVQTAKDLFVHRATVIYRLSRIKELAGIDFDNTDQVLYLLISLRFLL